MNINIIRLKDNIELICIVDGIMEDKVKTVFPYYIKFNSNDNMLGMMPYCPLSSESKFDIDVSRVEFIVEPKGIVKQKYLDMIREDYVTDLPEEDDKVIRLDGNHTCH